MNEQTKRGRGKGKKPALVGVSIRIDKETLDFFNQFPNRNNVMREALQLFINKEKGNTNETK
jgi:uncharacterized protein (DUF4415 family)